MPRRELHLVIAILLIWCVLLVSFGTLFIIFLRFAAGNPSLERLHSSALPLMPFDCHLPRWSIGA